MTSIYQRALGSEFHQLHPQIQRRFGLTSEAGVAAIGRGRMDRLWHGAPYTLPFLYIGTWRSIMFPEQGRDIPFTLENYAYRDVLGRETGRFRIEVQVSNPRWGPLFGYAGSFEVEWKQNANVEHLLPKRTEARE